MCDQHKHAKVETWITPENSRHLSSKMVQLYPGEEIPWHTTGPGREEVIVCIYGTIEVAIQPPDAPAGAPSWRAVPSGEAVFIPENTNHAVANTSDAGAQYAYIVTKQQQTKSPWPHWMHRHASAQPVVCDATPGL